MAQIEHRIEVPGHKEPQYAEIKRDNPKAYRSLVGGKWARMGRMQRDFLVSQGLRPEDRFLDVGCGNFRAGVQLVDYLEPTHYYGIDIGANVLSSGYDNELSEDQRRRLPTSNLRVTDRFYADFGVQFDMAIAQSVFTHVTLNHVRLCLHRVAQVMRDGGRFYATFFERPANYPVDGIEGERYTERNVYWYYRDDLAWAAGFSPWEFRYIGDWGHPLGQQMVEFTRLARPETRGRN